MTRGARVTLNDSDTGDGMYSSALLILTFSEGSGSEI